MSDKKRIHGSLDEIVEAVLNDQEELIEYLFSSAIINEDALRTALERFVVGKDTHKKGGEDEG